MYTRSFCPISLNRREPRHLCWQRTLGLAVALVLGQSAIALPEDADQPIHIQADYAEIDEQGETAVYRGSVQVDQGTLRVTGEEMTVVWQDKKVIRITATGTPAHYTQQIKADKGQVRADAKTIVYYTQEERLQLEGDAHLNQEGNTISGDLIRYDIVAGKVAATGDGPVRMTLQPVSPEQ